MSCKTKEDNESRSAGWLSKDRFIYYLLLLIPALAWLMAACNGKGGGNHP